MSITFDIAKIELKDGDERWISLQNSPLQVNFSNTNAFALMRSIIDDFDYAGMLQGDALREACNRLADRQAEAHRGRGPGDYSEYAERRYGQLSALFDRAYVSTGCVAWG